MASRSLSLGTGLVRGSSAVSEVLPTDSLGLSGKVDAERVSGAGEVSRECEDFWRRKMAASLPRGPCDIVPFA